MAHLHSDAIRSRDAKAFTELVEREAGACYRAAFRILGNAADAEDAVQEAFVTAYRAAAGYRADGPPGAWLLTIATRVALRRLARRRPIASIDDLGASEPASDDSPVAAALDDERDIAVRRAVADLPEPYREVVALRYFAELPLAEIAAQQGHPLSTTKSHVRRGLRLLRVRLVGDESE